MDRTNPLEVARAVAGLNVWDKVRIHNWALVPQMSDEPVIVTVPPPEKRKEVAGRLLLIPGFRIFREFMVLLRVPDAGVAMNPADLRHYEMVAAKNGYVEVVCCEPGYVPRAPQGDEAKYVASLLYECYGLMMRFEENPGLPKKFIDKNAMFARKEITEGNWQDGPLVCPNDSKIVFEENVCIDGKLRDEAVKLPIIPGEIWEVEFAMFPMFQTKDPKPRFLYIFAAVNAATGEKMCWDKMSVDLNETGDNGLLHMWEKLASRVLNAIKRCGRTPAELHVRSQRMMRFLRPLGMFLPFKIVQHSHLPQVEKAFEEVIKTGRI